jgi:RimJ/RimL family protein N-acetyltransferase
MQRSSISPAFDVIQSARLDLIPVTAESLVCQQRNSSQMRIELGAILNAKIPESWPHADWEPHVIDYLLNLIGTDAEAMGWCRYLVLRDDSTKTRTLIGTFGSGFPKAETGLAEIGYGLLPEWQRQGFAAEAVLTMLPWLQTRRAITAFVAQTFPHLRGSIRVLEKTGFRPAGVGYEDGTILFRLECETIKTTEPPEKK